jgi:hypothetical protein
MSEQEPKKNAASEFTFPLLELVILGGSKVFPQITGTLQDIIFWGALAALLLNIFLRRKHLLAAFDQNRGVFGASIAAIVIVVLTATQIPRAPTQKPNPTAHAAPVAPVSSAAPARARLAPAPVVAGGRPISPPLVPPDEDLRAMFQIVSPGDVGTDKLDLRIIFYNYGSKPVVITNMYVSEILSRAPAANDAGVSVMGRCHEVVFGPSFLSILPPAAPHAFPLKSGDEQIIFRPVAVAVNGIPLQNSDITIGSSNPTVVELSYNTDPAGADIVSIAVCPMIGLLQPDGASVDATCVGGFLEKVPTGGAIFGNGRLSQILPQVSKRSCPAFSDPVGKR